MSDGGIGVGDFEDLHRDRIVGSALSIVGAVVSSTGGRSELVDGRFRDVPMTFLESQGRGVWLSLSIIGLAVPLAMVAVRSLRIRQATFAIAALGTMLAVASVGVFYVPWLLAMVPAVVSEKRLRPGYAPASR